MTTLFLPQNVLKARNLFFEKGRDPAGLVPDAVVDSWKRCAGLGLSEVRPVSFDVIEDYRRRIRAEMNETLLRVSKRMFTQFSETFLRSHFAFMVTDPDGVVLDRYGNLENKTKVLRDSFQLGANLGETAIGTAAMNCALQAGQPVRTFGGEHYCDVNKVFHCAAAPVFDPLGNIVGALDMSADVPVSAMGVLDFITSCASEMERELLRDFTPGDFVINLHWFDSKEGGDTNAALKFDHDGRVTGLTQTARRLLGLKNGRPGELIFQDLFCQSFSKSMDDLNKSAGPVKLALHSDLPVLVSLSQKGSHRPGVRLRKYTQIGPLAKPETIFMGDDSFAEQMEMGTRALSMGLAILLNGETGSGKEVFAQELHRRSSHAGGRFIAVNCAAIPESLIEAELFGYSDGAFTGARRGGSPGRLEEANGGTLFLDEIGDMPMALQGRLLRVLDTREVTRIGSGTSRRIDCNVICATHKNLSSAIADERFRLDLFYRISGFTVMLKPLRERAELDQLLLYLLTLVDQSAPGIEPDALAILTAYHWPGNTREALNVLRQAILRGEPGEPIRVKHLGPALTNSQIKPPPVSSQESSQLVEDSLLKIADLEEVGIVRALKATRGNISHAAEALGLSRSTLQRRIRQNPALRQWDRSC